MGMRLRTRPKQKMRRDNILSIQYLNYPELDSTMDEAWRLVIADAIEGTACVSATAQREGRGQRGKSWASPIDAGIYLSLIHRFNNPREVLQKFTEQMCTVAAADAVLDAILAQSESKGTATNFRIKPINDIYYGDSKLAGILLESREWNDELIIVTGIGLNLRDVTRQLREELIEAPKAAPISFEEIFSRAGLKSWQPKNFKQRLTEAIARTVTIKYQDLLKD